MLHIEREILEQPDVIERLLTDERSTAKTIAQAIREFDPVFVMIAARGTSDNAARYAQYLMSIALELPVALATPSVHTLYEAKPRLGRALVMGISQSGSSHDVCQVLEDAKAQGALTVSITNNPDSALATVADYHLPLNCGEEISVAATKTYTAELAAIAMLVDTLKPQSGLAQLPSWVRETLSLSQEIEGWIQRYRYAEKIATVGRGYNYSTTYEISLKIKELCYITGEEYSEADFRHGPIAIVQEGFPVIAIAPLGKTLPLMNELLGQLVQKRAERLVITNDEQAKALATYAMRLPKELPEWVSPICAVIPGQIFAMNLAKVRGHQVDTPTGLQKVTITR
jgi:glucosamine--fructose-6-phosphate aminotransferase (isomerizing)